MSEENNTGNYLIWAITTLIIVAIIAGALYYGGVFNNKQERKVDVNVTVPSAAR